MTGRRINRRRHDEEWAVADSVRRAARHPGKIARVTAHRVWFIAL
jgi:hypothetical protein